MEVKRIFVFAGMLVFITLFLLGRSYYSYANIEKGKQYGDWLIACEASAKDKKEKICYAVQSVFNKDKDNKEARLLELKIGYFSN